MTGHLISNGYAPHEGFNWLHPALWQTLLSTRHGLFTWSPMLILSAVGVGIALWRKPNSAPGGELLVALLFSAVLLWYVNSAWRDWWFGWSFGNRAFLELAVLFALGLASLVEKVADARPTLRRAVVYVSAVAVLYNYVLMSLYAARYIPPDGYWF